MNTKSGQDTPPEMEPTVPSEELLSEECSPSIIKPEEKNYSSKLPVVDGRTRQYKQSLKDALVDIAQEESGAALSDESVEILHRFVENSTRGFVSTLPMTCRGHNCEYITICPLAQAGSKLPIGKPCPVESISAAGDIAKHLQSLGIDDITDPAHSFDLDMLCEMAGLEMIRRRCGHQLAKKPQLTVMQVVNVTEDGEEIYREEVNPIYEVFEKSTKQINKLRDALVATRKAQIEAGKNLTDSTQKASDMRERANELIKQRRKEAEAKKEIPIIKVEPTNE